MQLKVNQKAWGIVQLPYVKSISMRILDCRQFVTGVLDLECDGFCWLQHFQVSLFLCFVLHADPIVLFKTSLQRVRDPRSFPGKSRNACKHQPKTQTTKQTQKPLFQHNMKQLAESCFFAPVLVIFDFISPDNAIKTVKTVHIPPAPGLQAADHQDL